MDSNRKTSPALFLLVIVAFIAGLAIGLVVLGWWLWPVQWTGASIATMNSTEQQDFLRAAIDSYAYTSDLAVAQQRYNALGEVKEKILSDILANPGTLEKSDVEEFADALKAQPASINTSASGAMASPTAPASEMPITPATNLLTNRPLWMNICLAGGAVLVGLLLLLLIILFIRKRKSPKTESQTGDGIQPEGFGTYEGSLEQQPSGESGFEYSLPEVETGNTASVPGQNDLPDWFRDAGKEESQIPAENSVLAQDIDLSESDINEITSSNLSSLESKPAFSLESLEYDQGQETGLLPASDFSDEKTPPVESEIHSEELTLTPAQSTEVETFEETQEQTIAKFSREIELAPGIDPVDAQRLRSIGITAPLLLLKKGTSPQGRQSIAADLGIDEQQVLKWVNSIDLLRIKGLQIEDARMLSSAGVDLMVELATREPQKLLDKLDFTSKLISPGYHLPSLARVQNWIDQAKALPRVISNS